MQAVRHTTRLEHSSAPSSALPKHTPESGHAACLTPAARDCVLARSFFDTFALAGALFARLESGTIRSLRVSLSWANLSTQPCLIEVDGLEAVVVPAPAKAHGADAAARDRGDGEEGSGGAGGVEADAGEPGLRMVGSLMQRVLLNIAARVTDATLRICGGPGSASAVLRVAEVGLRAEGAPSGGDDGDHTAAGAAGMWVFAEDAELESVTKELSFDGLTLSLEEGGGAATPPKGGLDAQRRAPSPVPMPVPPPDGATPAAMTSSMMLASGGLDDSFHSAASAAWGAESLRADEVISAGTDGVLLGGVCDDVDGTSGKVVAKVRLKASPSSEVPLVDARVELGDAMARATPRQAGRLAQLLETLCTGAGALSDEDCDSCAGTDDGEHELLRSAHDTHPLSASIMDELLHDSEGLAAPPRVEGMDMTASIYYDPNSSEVKEEGKASWSAWGQWMADVVGDTQPQPPEQAQGQQTANARTAPATAAPENFRLALRTSRVVCVLLYDGALAPALPPEGISLEVSGLEAVATLTLGGGEDAYWAMEMQLNGLRADERLHCGLKDDERIAGAYAALAGPTAMLRASQRDARPAMATPAPLHARRVAWVDAPCGAQSGSGRWSDMRVRMHRRRGEPQQEVEIDVGPVGLCVDVACALRLARAVVAGMVEAGADTGVSSQASCAQHANSVDEGVATAAPLAARRVRLSVPAVRLLVAFPTVASLSCDDYAAFVQSGDGCAHRPNITWYLRDDFLSIEVLEAGAGEPLIALSHGEPTRPAGAVVKARKVALGLISRNSGGALVVKQLLEASCARETSLAFELSGAVPVQQQQQQQQAADVGGEAGVAEAAWRAASDDADPTAPIGVLRRESAQCLDATIPRLNVRATRASMSVIRDACVPALVAAGGAIASAVADVDAPAAQIALSARVGRTTWHMRMAASNCVEEEQAPTWQREINSLHWMVDGFRVDAVLALGGRSNDAFAVVAHGALECTTADGQVHLVSVSDELLGRAAGDGDGASHGRSGLLLAIARRASASGTVDTAIRCELGGLTIAAPSGGLAWMTDGVAEFLFGEDGFNTPRGGATSSAPFEPSTAGVTTVRLRARDVAVALTASPEQLRAARQLPLVLAVGGARCLATMDGATGGALLDVGATGAGLHVPPAGNTGPGLGVASARGLEEHAFAKACTERELSAVVRLGAAATGVDSVDIELTNKELVLDMCADVLHALQQAVALMSPPPNGASSDAPRAVADAATMASRASFAERALLETVFLDPGVVSDDSSAQPSEDPTGSNIYGNDGLPGAEVCEAMTLDPIETSPLPRVGYFDVNGEPEVRDSHVLPTSPRSRRALFADDGRGGAGGTGASAGSAQRPRPMLQTRVRARDMCVRVWLRSGLEWSSGGAASPPPAWAPLLSSAQDATTALQIAAERFGVSLELFGDASELASRLECLAADVVLYDCSAGAQWAKVIGAHDAPRADLRAARLRLDMVRPATLGSQTEPPEGRLRLDVEPLRARLDQQVIDFIAAFFAYRPQAAPSALVPAGDGDALFLQQVDVSCAYVRVDYFPRAMNTAALQAGQLSQLLNLAPWAEVVLELPRARLIGVSGAAAAGSAVADVFLKDILRWQVPRFFAGMEGLSPLFAVASALGNLLKAGSTGLRREQRIGGVARALLEALLREARKVLEKRGRVLQQ